MLDTSRLILQIDSGAAARQARMLPPQVWRVLRLFDGHRSLLEALDDSPLERATSLAVVRRLAELGLVRAIGRVQRPTARRLSSRTRKWLGSPIPASRDLPSEGEGLEAALDAALGGGTAPTAGEAATTTFGDISETREETLQDVLQMRIPVPEDPSGELLEALKLAEKVRRRLEAVHDVQSGPMVIMNAESPTFTNLDLEFFDSYQPDLGDHDDFMDLVMEPPTQPS